eukprot:NODE_4878_length_1100_cov_37.731832_g4332_i0.p1 GENE.NODE_4878_length_1100_cov_37.731832_g4332_i0~~NODE_4878_length_1100_cov_37.731832_g4332_i0.p1  ORF type:complete len:339 (-),score=70.60 NODE_4878_length_1100_cov_37.731832_g4332_i0:82-951(-)
MGTDKVYKLELHLDEDVTGETVRDLLWKHLMKITKDVVPQSWPSIYKIEYSLYPQDDPEDALIMTLPIKSQLYEPEYRVIMKESPVVRLRYNTWVRRAQQLQKIDEDIKQRENEQIKRRNMLFSQESKLRNAVKCWELCDREEIYRNAILSKNNIENQIIWIQGQSLIDDGWLKESESNRLRLRTSRNKAMMKDLNNKLQKKWLRYVYDVDSEYEQLSKTKDKLFKASWVWRLPLWVKNKEEDRINKGFMNPLHHKEYHRKKNADESTPGGGVASFLTLQRSLQDPLYS